MLDNLKIFISVVDAGSINKAAERLSSYPVTLNRHIKVLEEYLQLTLFARNINNLTLTPDGQRIYNSFNKLLNNIDHKISEVTTQSKSLRGTLRLVVTPMISALVVNDQLNKFMHQYPNVNIELYGTYFMHTGAEIKFDVGISFDYPPKNYFKIKKLVGIRAQLYATRKYVECYGNPQTITEAKNHRFIVLTHHPLGQDLNILHFKDEKGQDTELRIENYNLTVDNGIHARQLLTTDYGIALISDLMSADLKNNPEIVQILPNYFFRNTFPVYLIRSSTSNLVIDTFIAFLHKNILTQYNSLIEEFSP